jgi:hypothetical protein
VLGAHHLGGEDGRGRVERIDGRVDADGGDVTVEHGRRVEVGEGGGRGRVGEVVGGDVDGLHRGDGALVGGGDALLERAHLGGQGRLVTDGAGDAAEERGDLGAAWVKRKMLSMKSSTSCPSSSRKYSATVRALRPTRARAPGGSFIWP